jgi:nucleoside-diphosphate-sugar epimerase
MNKILLTGASGFVGQRLCSAFNAQNTDFLPVVRCGASTCRNTFVIDDIHASTNWQAALNGVEVVIHLAARVHVMCETAADPLPMFRRINVDGTLNLARQAATSGVRRFIFISSIKVNGEHTTVNKPFTEKNIANPQDAYGISKFEAEQGLLHIAQETGMEVVIIRPPLVYGPGVKANFASMMKWVGKGVPLPFGAVHNKRSLVALDNLVSFIVHCIDHPKAANQTFLISDGEDVSTTELIKKTAKALGKKPVLIPVPVSLMKFAAKLIGKGDVANRLFGSLQIDSSKARELLGWKPAFTMDEQLQKTAEAYLNEKTV